MAEIGLQEHPELLLGAMIASVGRLVNAREQELEEYSGNIVVNFTAKALEHTGKSVMRLGHIPTLLE